MQPDVSFIIAAYNAEGTIGRAIESALAQRGVSVDVIVANDRSTDRTASIAASYPESLVHVVTLAKNSGPGGARNAALGVAKGRWIAVLDADDEVLPDRMARMIARAEKAGAQAVVDNIEVIGEGQTRGEPMFPAGRLENIHEITLADFIASNLVFKSTFNFGYMKPIFERAFIEAHGLRYDEGLRIGEDYIFLASILAQGGKLVVEPAVGYSYHIRSGSISRVLELHHVISMLEADRKFVGTFELNDEAKAAQARRTRSLEEARSFISLVGHIKRRSLKDIVKVALSDPIALRHLSMPIAVRLKQLMPSTAAQRTGGIMK
ncbi:glycosyltransferase family 2 protein [Phyllobacterium leguminum]|uniref:Succinoglycan biosynthesis protein ExoO n=1 Tax=Phyllobacterium leguminum TaxID=314237 RepID=A0A318T705_9HYPH|nr:glycosyltransferase family 2 protein [Phyllobacterium leguminum]PYE88807.1 succinoglycan biosynthesis protein ExoO [Phyllobacterium leguminum]